MVDEGQERVFRLPALAYLAVLFLVFGVTALVMQPVLLVLYVLPLIAIAFIARVATVVDGGGIRVRALFGQRRLAWADVRGLSVGGRNVYAVTTRGTYRLPLVRINDLPEIARLSAGRIPALPDPVPKYAPSGRRRR